jgi:hypothetical protein
MFFREARKKRYQVFIPLIGYLFSEEPFATLGFLFKIKACKKFCHRRPVGSALGVHIIDIGVEVYEK